jgi:ribonuclease BN (tRNA processing enzyme)
MHTRRIRRCYTTTKCLWTRRESNIVVCHVCASASTRLTLLFLVPTLGYVFTTNRQPYSKLAILGDTFDPSALAPLAHDADILVHEATTAWVPPHLKQGRRDGHSFLRDDESEVTGTEAAVERAVAMGHSTPGMAGAFARSIGARTLFLNHIGTPFVTAQHSARVCRC